MMPGLDASGFGAALVLFLLALAAVVLNLAVLVGLARRKAGFKAALAIGAASVLSFVSFLVVRLAARDFFSSILVGIFFLPAALGLLSIAAACCAARRAGVRGAGLALCGAILLAGLGASAYVGVRWRAMALRGALWDAVLREEVAPAQQLLARGAAGEAADRPFLDELLVKSARDVNVELARALLDAGANPNAGDLDDAGRGGAVRSPLLAAIGADPILRLHPIAPETHARNRLQVVTLLLDRGANPNPAVGKGLTPAARAWAQGSDDLLRLLDARGARDARTVATQFEELLAAAAAGDARRVGEIVAPYGAQFQNDHPGRSPLVVAAANGHLDVVNRLLDAFGGSVQCANAERALAAAAERNEVAIYRRLLDVCFNEYNARPLIIAAAAGNVELIRAALAKGYSPRGVEPGSGRTALAAAIDGGHPEAVRLLRDAGASESGGP